MKGRNKLMSTISISISFRDTEITILKQIQELKVAPCDKARDCWFPF